MVVDSFTAGVDAFSFDWSQDNNWIVPPVRLISKTISHLMTCKGKGVLVAPIMDFIAFLVKYCR